MERGSVRMNNQTVSRLINLWCPRIREEQGQDTYTFHEKSINAFVDALVEECVKSCYQVGQDTDSMVVAQRIATALRQQFK